MLSGRAARIGERRLGLGLAKTAQKPMRVKTANLGRGQRRGPQARQPRQSWPLHADRSLKIEWAQTHQGYRPRSVFQTGRPDQTAKLMRNKASPSVLRQMAKPAARQWHHSKTIGFTLGLAANLPARRGCTHYVMGRSTDIWFVCNPHMQHGRCIDVLCIHHGSNTLQRGRSWTFQIQFLEAPRGRRPRGFALLNHARRAVNGVNAYP